MNAPFPQGWINDPAEVQGVLATMPYPYFASAARNLYGSGAGKTVLLYKAWKDVYGQYFPYPAQQIGCCVSRGYSEGVDLLECVQIAVGKKNEVFTPVSHEAVYAVARVDVGGQRWSTRDGAVGAWAAKAVTDYGVLSQEVVGPYDDNRCKQWGARGVPADLAPQLAAHKVGAASLVRTTAELDDALANGYPVPVCSSQGFTMTRDQNGFCRASGTWQHCMLFCGVRTDIPGYLIMQSWGMTTPDGPLALDQPPNSFWVLPNTIAGMLREEDTFALSSVNGWPGQKIPDRWTYEGFA